MSTETTYVKSSAMPAQTVQPLATGATSPMQSAQMQQQQQTQQQMALIGKGKSGGGKRKRYLTKRTKFRGGASGVANSAQIVVPAVQPGAVNSAKTESQYADLTALASKQESEAVFDSGNTAGVAATQKGGRKMKSERKMKGGWPIWGCLSGGKKSKRKHRRHNRKTRKTRRTRSKR